MMAIPSEFCPIWIIVLLAILLVFVRYNRNGQLWGGSHPALNL